tara:strand:+ start:1375 stop:1902 length:528 start_codon:yes stop_codon:yes gene_type:complete
MSKWATGKFALGISDRSGAAYPLRKMRKEWTGMLVGWDEWEPKQPQLNPSKAPADAQALRDARPDRTAPEVLVLLPNNPFQSANAASPIVRITEPGSNRSVGDIVRLRSTEAFDGFTSSALEYSSGYAIVEVYNDNVKYDYTINISASGSSETGVTPGASGGGSVASVGPVTVSN